MIIPTPFPRSSNFESGEFQGPISIIGIDAVTNEILYQCSSFAEAEAMGFDNISTIISDKYGRSQSKGVRWFKAENFDVNNVLPLEIPNAKPVYCIERKQHFRSTMEAEKEMREMGFAVSGSKISSVLNGHRKKAGGFTWKESKLSTAEIIAQDPNTFVDYRPPKNSNAKKSVRLISDKTTTNKIFNSVTDAGRFLKTSAGNVTRAIKNKSMIKGYRAELVEDS